MGLHDSDGGTYSTRAMRPAGPAPTDTAKLWKYADNATGRLEFHATQQAGERLRLIRPPLGVAAAPASTTTATKDED